MNKALVARAAPPSALRHRDRRRQGGCAGWDRPHRQRVGGGPSVCASLPHGTGGQCEGPFRATHDKLHVSQHRQRLPVRVLLIVLMGFCCCCCCFCCCSCVTCCCDDQSYVVHGSTRSSLRFSCAGAIRTCMPHACTNAFMHVDQSSVDPYMPRAQVFGQRHCPCE